MRGHARRCCRPARPGVTDSHGPWWAIVLNTNSFAMGSLLAVGDGMRTLGLLLSLLVTGTQAATDQKAVVPEGTVIAVAAVTGFDIDRLSPGLREDIRNLAGTTNWPNGSKPSGRDTSPRCAP